MNLLTTQLHKFGFGALLLGSVALSACEKETEELCGGAPSITDVTRPEKRDTVLTKGNLADWIIIRGNNFCSVQSVVFNDLEAPLADAYVTPTEITVRIPRAIPKNITNKIIVTTEGGMAEKAYTISIPPLAVRGLSNEYAAPGTTAAVVGQNFDLYGVTPEKGKVLWNGTPVSITRTTADSVYFVVPTSATPGNTVKIQDANNVQTNVPGRYKDDRNVVFGYDTGGSVWGGTDFITTGPTPAPVNGPFLRVNKAIGAWAWTEFTANNTIVLPMDVLTNPNNYVLKFEYNTLKPFNTNVIKIAIDGDPGAATTPNTYLWRPSSPINTRGKWSTMRINMSDLLTTGLVPSRTQHEFRLLFHGDGALDADISFDTFRIVPKG